jgi:hypothetical protein
MEMAPKLSKFDVVNISKKYLRIASSKIRGDAHLLPPPFVVCLSYAAKS